MNDNQKPLEDEIEPENPHLETRIATEVLATEAPLNPLNGLPLTSDELKKRQKLEEKVIRSTKPFFQSLTTNLLVLSFFLIGAIFSISGAIDIRWVILFISPIDIFLMSLHVKKAKKKIDSRLKKKLFKKLFSDIPFLDSLSRCLACVLFFCVEWVHGFFYTLVLGPIGIATLIIFFKNLCKSCKV